MYKVKNSLIALVGLMALLGVIAVITPRTGVGQNVKAPQDVRVVGTTVTQPVSASSPLPVTGDVNIGNTPTVNAQQSGSWNVGINGMPTVKVDNTANPLFVRDVDNPASQPFQAATSFGIAAQQIRGGGVLTTVPLGKRLVIEHVSVRARVQPNQKLAEAEILIAVANNNNGGHPIDYYFALNDQGDNLFMANQQVRLYADPGTEVQVAATRNASDGSGFVYFSISGYFVDVP